MAILMRRTSKISYYDGFCELIGFIIILRIMSKSESDNDSSGDEDFEAHAHLFRSSLDVGSHFIDIVPETELVFNNYQGSLLTQLTIKNVTSKAHVAYLER
jgi:hypothetical protein